MSELRLTKYQVEYLKRFQERNQHLNISVEKLYKTVKNTFQNLQDPIGLDELRAFTSDSYIIIESHENDFEELIKYQNKENVHQSLKVEYENHNITIVEYGNLKSIFINDQLLLSCSISKSKKQIRCDFQNKFIVLSQENSIWFYNNLISPFKSTQSNENSFLIKKSSWDFLPVNENPIYLFSDPTANNYQQYFDNYNYHNEENLKESIFGFALSYVNENSFLLNQSYKESKNLLETINTIFKDYVLNQSTRIFNSLGYSYINEESRFVRIFGLNEKLVIIYISKNIENNFEHELKLYAEKLSYNRIFTTHQYFLKENLDKYYNDIKFSQEIKAPKNIIEAIIKHAEDDFEDQTKDKLIELILNSTSHDILKIATFFSGLINNKKYDISILKENRLIENLSPIFITSNLDILLLDYQIKLNFNPRQKVLYLLYLENPKGIHLNNLIDHRKRLQELYNLCRLSASEEMTRSVINKMTDNFNYQEKNKIISRIKTEVKTAFLRINPKLAELYYINGARGEEKNIEIVSYGEDYIGYYFEF